THANTDDCYVIFEEKVYDITEYLQSHSDRFLDINSWCGKDITEDFKSRAGEGRDHTGGYNVLEKYLVGNLTTEEVDSSSADNAINTNIQIAAAIGVLVL